MPDECVLDDVFERFLNGNCLFKDREVMRHDYVPDNLPHREEQIRQLGEIVAPILKGSRSSNVFIYGKTGTGKTAVVRYVSNKLAQKAHDFGKAVKVCYVNCKLVGTEYRVFSSLCNSTGTTVPFTGLALGEISERFRTKLDLYGLFLLIVLDEIDTLVKERGDFLLYELTRMNETLSNSKISIVGISNDLRFKEFLDPRVLSCLSEEEMVFRPYDAAELQNILWNRARLAFPEGILLDGAVSLCSALAAAEHGDARRALDLLRVSGEIAEREGSGTIMEDHVRRAEKSIERDRITEALKNLPPHSKIVLFSVYVLNKANAHSVATGDIYDVYTEVCGELGLSPLTQRRVSGLINELDVIGLLNSRVVSMGRYGRTKKIRLDVSRSLIRTAFASEDRLRNLINYVPKCSPAHSSDGT